MGYAYVEMLARRFKEATARAEAAEARNKVLEEALRLIDQMSGSHDAVGHVARQALGSEQK